MMDSNMTTLKIVKKSLNNNYLVTLAIGTSYLQKFELTVLNSWIAYAEKHNCGIIVIVKDLVPKSSTHWKKPTWQKMLIGETILEKMPDVDILCYLDTDVLINPSAPNVFEEFVSGKIGVVSLRSNLPFDYDETLIRLALLRHRYLDDTYPLDSALFIGIESLYKAHNLSSQKDEFCAGFLLFRPGEMAQIMKEWFYLYDKSVESITNNGDQTHLNYHIQNNNLENLIIYKYQAIWAFEVANYYSFLFMNRFKDIALYHECIKSSLFRVYFLHFAGSWTESSTFSLHAFELGDAYLNLFKEYSLYLEQNVIGEPLGTIKPKEFD